MENQNEYDSAFPSEQTQDNQHNNGLTKREYFAGLAMQGILAANMYPNISSTPKDIAKYSIQLADELLTHLNSK